ncbi:MAG: hypothetical protein R3314_06930 [Longimicrobiales bacterium]|nr:hypothetical protein [Longimicrobiales bacterium]
MTKTRCETALLSGILAAVLGIAGCGGHRLAEYDFVDQSLAVVYFSAPAPELWTGGYDVDGDNPLEVVVSAGGRVAREVEARRAQARLDSAAARVDLAARMAERTLERSSRYLGTRPVEDESGADYLLEVDIRRTGLDAGRNAAYLVVYGEAVLLDARTGREIWDVEVSGRDRLTPGLWGSPDVVEDVLTAGALSSVSVDDFEQILTRLADFVADRIGRELRADLRSARD